MKKITTLLLPLLFITSTFADSAFNTSLRYGSRGPEVREMQEFLIDQGFLTGSATGNFYALSLKAVKAFQVKYNLSSSGFWGPLTRQKANELLAISESDKEATNTPVLTPNSTPQQTFTPQVQQVPVLQYIPVSVPLVDTKAQQRQAIEDEYNLKMSNLNLKASELEQLRSKITEMAIFWNTEYSVKDPRPSTPSFISTQNQIETMRKIFEDMMSLNRWSMNTPNELSTRLGDVLNVIYNQQAQIQLEKQTKISEIK